MPAHTPSHTSSEHIHRRRKRTTNMSETVVIPRPTMMQGFGDGATDPMLFLSSEATAGMAPALLDTALVLVTHGAMRMEQRRMNGPWQAIHVHQGDLLLRPGGIGPYEVRWTGLPPDHSRRSYCICQGLVLRDWYRRRICRHAYQDAEAVSPELRWREERHNGRDEPVQGQY